MLGALMARRPVSKELWLQLQPLIPAFVLSAKGGARKRTVSDEAALNGILFVLHTGIAWEDLPQSLGYGSGHDVLAAAARLERCRGVAETAPCHAGSPA